MVSAFGPQAASVAAADGDGVWMTRPQEDVLKAFAKAKGTGPKIGQLTVCWAPTVKEAEETAYRAWPNTGLPGQLSQDLPTPTHFEQACQLVRKEDITQKVPCGPDPGPVLDELRQYESAGLDHVHIHQIGPDQDGFLEFWKRELRPKL